MHISNDHTHRAAVAPRPLRSLLAGSLAVALAGCVAGGTDPFLDGEDTRVDQAASALGSACVLGDGYSIPSGGNVTVYPVSCGSDCYDYPNGGFPLTIFCVDGIAGETNPALSGGSLLPLVNASEFNGYGTRCSARPTAAYAQSADRKTCIPR